jgi:hypothetical protein
MYRKKKVENYHGSIISQFQELKSDPYDVIAGCSKTEET